MDSPEKIRIGLNCGSSQRPRNLHAIDGSIRLRMSDKAIIPEFGAGTYPIETSHIPANE